ncbi:hypothetical protein EST38_g6202 [Candolleomyces aberdarensis]|uniref:D-xylose 1-dehydrogenase (NADP(+), D-xylono-1,5-lactone-forming) n=1 Tax=Candolleomyces aberdarensis TaxID=2316362 RepID=A0A4Q2DIH9_9AGAR|nr:hypothetical protein EST38_g6202 [Candolleomyces aberdarensis]
MALLLEGLTFLHEYTYSWLHAVPQKKDNALKVGVLSTALINIGGIIEPCKTHEDVILWGIASRDAETASKYASKHGFKVSYGSYGELIADPQIDFVYISLPNSLHFEWACKSLKAGKHVLLEKPFTSNAKEAEILVDLTKKENKVLLEAFHWQFHPAAHRFREILDSGKLGDILKTDSRMTSTPSVPAGDIRWKYELSGGSLMDASYTVSFTRFALHARTPDAVLYAKAHPAKNDPRVDSSMHATLRFKGGGEGDVYSTTYTDLARPWLYGIIPRFWEFPSIKVETEHAEVYFYNAMLPHLYHYIGITDKKTRKTRYEQVYKGGLAWKDRGETWWSTYRYQLEAFVDKVRGREPVWWIPGEDSINEMKTIDEIYTASGLALRPTSTYALQP